MDIWRGCGVPPAGWFVTSAAMVATQLCKALQMFVVLYLSADSVTGDSHMRFVSFKVYWHFGETWKFTHFSFVRDN